MTNWNHVPDLMKRFGGVDAVVSCYADNAVRQGFERTWAAPLKAEAARIAATVDAGPAAADFRKCIESITQALESPEAGRRRGVALFAAEGGRKLETFYLDAGAPNRLVRAAQPYVVPLVEAQYRGRTMLVVLTDTHAARLYRTGPGGPTPAGQVDVDVGPNLGSTGRRWGGEQATLDRKRREQLVRFHRKLAEAIVREFDKADDAGIVLLGPHEVLRALRAELPATAAAAIVHEAPHGSRIDDTDVTGAAAVAAAAEFASRRGRVLGEAAQRTAGGLGVIQGPGEVLTALRHGQVAELAFFGDPGLTGSACIVCRSIFVERRDACPYCGNRCEPAELRQEMLLWAIRHTVPFDFLGPEPTVDRAGGVLALLKRDDLYSTPAGAPAGSSVASS
jgi:hypothetical protein